MPGLTILGARENVEESLRTPPFAGLALRSVAVAGYGAGARSYAKARQALQAFAGWVLPLR
jgi:hypothetical protein